MNRDTMSFATKLSFIRYADDTERDVMKRPKTDGGKFSLPGVIDVIREGDVLTVVPRAPSQPGTNRASPLAANSEFRVVYDHRPMPVPEDETFDVIRARVHKQWSKTPKKHDPISKALRDKIAAWSADFDAKNSSSATPEAQ